MSATYGKLRGDLLSNFQKDNVLEAYRILAEAESVLSQEEFGKLNEMKEAQLVGENVRNADKCLQMLSDYDSWTPVHDEAEIQIWTQEASGDYFVRAEMTVHKPVFPILALFSEVDLLQQLVQGMTLAEVIYEPSMFRKLIRYRYDLPWPISHRELILECFGLPVVQAKSVLISLRTPTDDRYLDFSIPQAEAGVERFEIPFGCLNLMYVSAEETLLTIIVRSNMHMSLLPVSLVNYGTKQVVFSMMQSIQSYILAYEGSEYERRVKTKWQYYSEVSRRMHEFLETS